MSRTIAGCVMALGIAAGNAVAQTIDIDFDTDPGGGTIAAGTNLVDDATYAPVGVTFERVGGTTCGPDVYTNDNNPDGFGTTPNVVSTCAPPTASDINGNSFGQIQANFDFDADEVCIVVNPINADSAANLTAYDAADQVIDSQTSVDGVTGPLCVSGNGIRYVRFPGVGPTGNDFARFDDLSVRPQAGQAFAIPTLSTGFGALLVLLLAGLGVYFLRRF